MQGDLFRGDVSDGSRQLVVAPVLLPSLSFILSFCSPTPLSFLF